MFPGYTICVEKDVIKIKRKENIGLYTQFEYIEEFFGRPLLKALYDDYLYEWSLNCYSRDETASVGLWLTKDFLDKESFEKLPLSFVSWFFDPDEPFLITTHGKAGYRLFCHVLYEQWFKTAQLVLSFDSKGR